MLRLRNTILSPRTPAALVCALTIGACGDDKSGDTDDATATASTTASATATSSASSEGTSSSASASTSSDASTSGGTSTSSDASTSSDTSTSTTGPATGPGTFPGETGLDAFCRRFVECGGTYYDDAQACIDASLDYWGSCPSRRDALDAFGSCMADLSCDEWSPDVYNPNSTPCAEEWGDLGASDPC
ncbi:MAG: hypothetical protein KC420_20065 [Myxococcales bacterium]|nr:hypothetical protein [Myxococcales bacterium]